MLEQSDLPQAALKSRAGEAGTTTRRVLVIDDDHLHRLVICRTAAKAGYIPAGAASCDEAAQQLRDGTFDCITLDLSLGDHAGIEMLHRLWSIGCTAPIIIISGCDDATCSETERVAASLKLNVWDSIPKPVDLSMLRTTLERLKAESDGRPAGEIASPQISPA